MLEISLLEVPAERGDALHGARARDGAGEADGPSEYVRAWKNRGLRTVARFDTEEREAGQAALKGIEYNIRQVHVYRNTHSTQYRTT